MKEEKDMEEDEREDDPVDQPGAQLGEIRGTEGFVRGEDGE